ncbi:MAG: hypothetical protein DWQ10_16895 [Calditrichaeota bacterium]|nr:MAG: hypothetical protein DWQ10_16895 [Calditrichota bacterium]
MKILLESAFQRAGLANNMIQRIFPNNLAAIITKKICKHKYSIKLLQVFKKFAILRAIDCANLILTR